MKSTRKDLERYGFRFVVTDTVIGEIEIQIPLWVHGSPGERERVRMSVMNGDRFIIGRAAKGSFRNGYSWLCKQTPLRGTGYTKLIRLIETSDGLHSFDKPRYKDMVASAFDLARKALLEMVRIGPKI